MSYVIQARLSNAKHPENGSNEILFPLSREDYPGEIQRLGELQAGDAIRRDCKVEEIDSYYEILQCLKGQVVNVDELDYLAKRLDSFDEYEAQQFQASCYVSGPKDIKDLINMTFCCQETTVISDFSKLEETGKQHYLVLHGGAAPVAELEAVDGKALAEKLIQSGKGKPTPYGLFFRNGMRMEELYQRIGFPPYLWDERLAELEIKHNGMTTFAYLPASQLETERFLQRERIVRLDDCKLKLRPLYGPINAIELSGGMAELQEWNKLFEQLIVMPRQRQQAFCAALEVTGAEDLAQIQLLIASMDDFDLVPGVHDSESYGRYMIQKSSKYAYDESLDCYYNYEAFGEFLMSHEVGQMTKQGYLKCEEGSAFLDFFTQESPELGQTQGDQTMQMGGM